MVKPRYAKPALTVPEQVDLLISRGLQGADKAELTAFLLRVSYYRLRGYTYPFQDNSGPDHPFYTATSWDQVLHCYAFDQQLRLLMLGAIEAIEVAFRAQLVLTFSNSHGAQWYEDSQLFYRRDSWEKDLAALDKEWARAREAFVEHYRRRYDDSVRPPAWMMLETCSMGVLSKLFENLDVALDAKKALAQYFGFHSRSLQILSSWLHHLSSVRNICAHHGRLYSRVLLQSPRFLERPASAWVHAWPDPQRVYASLCVVSYLMNRIHSAHPFNDQVARLLTQANPGQLRSMGVPDHWQTQPLWNSP